MDEIRRILVVVLDIMNARAAVGRGLAVAKRNGAELVVLHVQHDPLGAEGWNLPFLALTEEYRKLLEEAKETVADAIRAERGEGVAVRELVREGNPLKVILEVIEKERVDLLFLLAHEEGKLEHFLFGRLREELLRRMPCSIYLAKREVA